MSHLTNLDLNAYRIPHDDVAQLMSPSLVVFLDQVRENLKQMQDFWTETSIAGAHISRPQRSLPSSPNWFVSAFAISNVQQHEKPRSC